MKITDIETIPVSLPVGKFRDGADKVMEVNYPEKYCSGKSARFLYKGGDDGIVWLSNVIVKIHTDEGITGIGEAACDLAEPVYGVKNMIDMKMKPYLIGQDPMEWEYLIDRISWDSTRGATRYAASGIDLALHDLVGKILGIPVCTLLGGCRRNKLLASIEVPRNTPEKVAEHSYEYYQQGIRGIKAKVGSNPVADAEVITAIREKLGPEVSIRADANCSYSVKDALLFCRLVENANVDLEVLEQPVGTLDIDGLKQIKDSTGIPIEADESAFSLEMTWKILQMGAVDMINTKCAKAYGIKGVREWSALAKAAGIPVVIGTEWGTASKIAAKLHLGAAVANTNPVVEFTEIMIHDILLQDQLQLVDGYLAVPGKPGLGMDPDEDKIAEFRIDTRR